jgi:hypothetical protein
MGRIIGIVLSQLLMCAGTVGLYHACMRAAKNPREKVRANWVEKRIKEEFEGK